MSSCQRSNKSACSAEAIIEKSDIVMTSMNSRNFTLTEDIIKRALNKRRRKPIFLIDTGVPRDVDFAVAKLEDAFLYSLNDLEKSTREGAKKNLMETQKAQEIIEEESVDGSFESSFSMSIYDSPYFDTPVENYLVQIGTRSVL